MNRSVENRLVRTVAVVGAGMLMASVGADMMQEYTGSAWPASRGKKLGIPKLSQISRLPVADRTLRDEPEFSSRIDGLNPMLGDPGLADVFDTISPESPRPPCESTTCGWITAAGSPLPQAFVLEDHIQQNEEHVVDSIVRWDPTESKRRLD